MPRCRAFPRRCRPRTAHPPRTGTAHPAKDRDSEAKIRSATDDIILNEGVRILADYVNVLSPAADKSVRTRRTEAASVSRY